MLKKIKQIIFIFVLSFQYFLYGQWVVTDHMTQALLYMQTAEQTEHVIQQFMKIKTSAQDVLVLVKEYKKILEEIKCGAYRLYELSAQLKNHKISSCLLDADLRILTYSFHAQSEVLNLAEQVAKNIIRGVLDKDAKDNFSESHQKFLVALEKYQQKRREIQMVEQRLSQILHQYLQYETQSKNFELYYDKVACK